MTEKKLTGNEMFEEVKEECERIVEKIKGKGKKRQNGVLFFINRNRILGWYEDGDENMDIKYVMYKFKLINYICKYMTKTETRSNCFAKLRQIFYEIEHHD